MQNDRPDEQIAAEIGYAFLQQKITRTERIKTGNQNYVYCLEVSGPRSYVLRLTTGDCKENFVAALYWQKKLLALGVPLAKFIGHDLNGVHSRFPTLLMERLPGDDIGNVYATLNDTQKRDLAQQMARIHDATRVLPEGSSFGYASAYELPPPYPTWFAFLENDLNIAAARIRQTSVFEESFILRAQLIAEKMMTDFASVRPQPFMPDTTVKNVMVHEGMLSGIVDVDVMCFGDPLFVLSLTYAGSKIDGHDTHYADYWKASLSLDLLVEKRLEFYKLMHVLWFMGECSAQVANNGLNGNFNPEHLRQMYNETFDILQN